MSEKAEALIRAQFERTDAEPDADGDDTESVRISDSLDEDDVSEVGFVEKLFDEGDGDDYVVHVRVSSE